MPTLANSPKLLRHFSTVAVFENSVNFYLEILIGLSVLVYLYQKMKSKIRCGWIDPYEKKAKFILQSILTLFAPGHGISVVHMFR